MIDVNNDLLTLSKMAEKETGLRIPEQAPISLQGLREKLRGKLHAAALVLSIMASTAGTLVQSESVQAADQSTASMYLENKDQLFDEFLVEYGRENRLPKDVEAWSEDQFDAAILEFDDWAMSRMTDELIAEAERERLGAR